MVNVFGFCKDVWEGKELLDQRGYLSGLLSLAEEHWLGLIVLLVGVFFFVGICIDRPERAKKDEYNKRRTAARAKNGKRNGKQK